MAAAATILLRRSSACVFSSASHFYLSTAAKRSRLLVPTAISSVRQLSSSPVMSNIQTPSPDAKPVNQDDDQFVREILSQMQSMRGEIESLRKEKEEKVLKANNDEGKEESPQEKEVVHVVKEKNPLLKEIESVMSNAEFSTPGKMLPHGFEVECDKPGVAKFTLKKSHKKETINIEVSYPKGEEDTVDDEFVMPVIVKVSFPRIFTSTVAEFHCTAWPCLLVIEKIKDPSDGSHNEGVLFERLPRSLQTKFYNYLAIRGVDDNIAHILHDYMVHKMNRENMRGLGKFKKMVEE